MLLSCYCNNNKRLASFIICVVFGLDLTNYKSIRILNASINCAEIWHTARGCSRAPVCGVSARCSLAFGIDKQLIVEFAIWPSSSGNSVFVVLTSIDDISASRHRRKSSFGHTLRLVFLYTSTEFHPSRSNRSSFVVRGFAASRRLKQSTELQLQPSISQLPEQLES